MYLYFQGWTRSGSQCQRKLQPYSQLTGIVLLPLLGQPDRNFFPEKLCKILHVATSMSSISLYWRSSSEDLAIDSFKQINVMFCSGENSPARTLTVPWCLPHFVR